MNESNKDPSERKHIVTSLAGMHCLHWSHSWRLVTLGTIDNREDLAVGLIGGLSQFN